MKKKIIISGIIVIALISLLPFPQKVERTYYGVNTFNGEKADITLDMKYLRFLFLKDKLYGEIAVTFGNKTTVYGEHMAYSGLWPLNNEDKTMHVLGGWYYNPETIMYDYGNGNLGSKNVGFEAAIAYISRDFSKIVLYHEPRDISEDPQIKQYAGNVEENKTDETLKYFEGFVR